MEQAKVDLFIGTMSDKFPLHKMMLIRSQLEKMDDSRFQYVQTLDYKSPTILLVVSLFFGYLGIDRFMLGDIGLGFLKLFTCGGFGIWTIVDWFMVMDNTKESNFNLFMQYAH